MTQLTVELSEEAARIIEEQVSSGMAASPGAVIEEALQQLAWRRQEDADPEFGE